MSGRIEIERHLNVEVNMIQFKEETSLVLQCVPYVFTIWEFMVLGCNLYQNVSKVSFTESVVEAMKGFADIL